MEESPPSHKVRDNFGPQLIAPSTYPVGTYDDRQYVSTECGLLQCRCAGVHGLDGTDSSFPDGHPRRRRCTYPSYPVPVPGTWKVIS